MNYSKLQKITSFGVIFVLLFSITFRIPFFAFLTKASAQDKAFYNIVSIIVNEDVYSTIKSEVKRYAKDIQGVLENTKAVILPVPNDVSQIDISSLNESLYFEGYNGLKGEDKASFESKLIGTVLVGSLPVPILSNNNKTTKSIFPYTDFEDKAYVYNHENGFYEKNPESYEELRAEIWHGVISPNTGSSSSDIQGLKDYFDKNHDFYAGTGNFTLGDNVINGKIGDKPSKDYEPFVFYFDQFREEKSLHYPSYKSYEVYSENREDIAYNRYTKKLARAIKQSIVGAENDSIGNLLSKVTGGSVSLPGDSLENASDISTRTIIQKATKKFVEIFNGGQIEDLRTNVHNAGRYNKDGSKVNVDFIPYIVSTLDLISDEVIKSVNTDLESQIDGLVVSGMTRNIALPTLVDETTVKSVDLFDIGFIDIVKSEKSINFLHGRNANTIESADQCSIYRGSSENDGNLVESNRAFNIKNIGPDGELCGEGGENSQGLWGGNSPINGTSQNGGPIELGSRELDLSITPLFDILGSKAGGGEEDIISPVNCLEPNLLLAIKDKGGLLEATDYDYKIPEPGETMGILDGEETNWCPIENIKKDVGMSFEDAYNSDSSEFGPCGRKVVLDGEGVISEDVSALDAGADLTCEYNIYYYKSIPSYIFHKSPTKRELDLEIKNPATPNLAVDRDRYVDFISAAGEYARIDYPRLFRLGGGTLEETESNLNRELSRIGGKISSIVSSNADASGDVYDLLKNGENPEGGFDLISYLKNKPNKTLTIGGETKDVNYYDFLVFSIFWNNLSNTSGKYKFVMENYLSDEFGGNKYDFLLPKNKRQYEIAYLGAPGDSSNMYIKLDPEAKGENPFADIVGENTLLDSSLIGVKTISNDIESEQGLFKCSPPDGVPIWEWIPAVICWINNMLPPSISISSNGDYPGSSLTQGEIDEIANYEDVGDENNNGVNDAIEEALQSGKLEFSSDAGKYNYTKAGELKVVLKDGIGEAAKKVLIDSQSYVQFYIKSIKDINTKENIYSEGDENTENISDYISFNNIKLRLNNGEAKYSFATKTKDADITFGVKLENKTLDISLEKDLKIKIRGDNLSLDSTSISNNILDIGSSITKAGTNVYIYNEFEKNIGDIPLSEDGLFVGVSNKSKTGDILDIKSPVSVQIINSFGDIEFESSNLKLSGIKTLLNIKETGTYDLIIKDKSGFVVSKEIDIIAGPPEKLDITLGSTILEKGGAVTTNIVTILDKFGNPVTGEYYDLDLKILRGNDSIKFVENEEDSISYKTFEGFRAFRIKSRDNTGRSKIKINLLQDNKILKTKSSDIIKVVDKIKLNIRGAEKLVVGKKDYQIDIQVTDGDNIIDDLNSRIYLNIPKKYGKTLNPYYDIENGKVTIDFQTAYLAGKNIPFEFQIEGLSKIQKEYFTILPEKPLKIDLKSSKTRMEAKQGNSTTIKAELKDAYGNLVFTDNETSLALELPEEYESIITLGDTSKKVSGGKTSFEINATPNPGTAYIKITSNPDLSLNSLEIDGQAPFSKSSLGISSLLKNGKLTELGKKVFYEVDSDNIRSRFNTKAGLENNSVFKTLSSGVQNRLTNLWENKNTFSIYGVGENSIKIETYFFWKKANIIAKKYNALYTTLLGAPYGDFTKKDYLAGGILFDKNNRSLAVTSIFNNPYLYNDILQITGKGAVKKVYNSSDLTQDIEIKLGSNEDNIPYLDLFNNSLNTYIGKIFFNFDGSTDIKICEGDACNKDFSKDTIFFEQSSSSYSFEAENNGLKITNDIGETLLNIDKSGKISKHPSISLELNNSDSKATLFDIKLSNAIIGKVGFYFSSNKIKVIKKEARLKAVLNNSKRSIVLSLETDDYPIRDILTSDGESIKAIYYLDPFSKKYSLNTFSKENPYSYENFAVEEGLGWKGGNKSLLEFAAGKTVGDAVKSNASIGIINLGDPVIALKKIKANLPGTITPRKFDRTIGKKLNKYGISSYQVFDYNNDDKDDILLISVDGFFKLLENKDIHGKILNQRNLAKVEDIGDKKLVLAGDFTGDGYEDIFFVNSKGNPYLLNNEEKDFTRVDLTDQFNLGARIIISRVFDMDDDGIDDIVVLDDAGVISIFYGGGRSSQPSFTPKKVSDSQGISLGYEPRNDLGLIYFDGLSEGLPETSSGSEDIVNSQIFVSLPYNSGVSSDVGTGDLLSSIPSDFSSDLGASLDNLSGDIGDLIDSNPSTIGVNNLNPTTQTTFIKSEYSEMAGISVEKTFTDISLSPLKSGDTVSVEIKLTNQLNSTLNNIAYLDDIPKIFTLDGGGVFNSKELPVKAGIGDYEVLIDNFSLESKESLTITYSLKTKAIKYGFIEVGLFEKDEAGNDPYGDIIFKMDEKNCSDTVSIFRSTDKRDYESGEKQPVCDDAKLELPANIEKNNVDTNNNGIPDYMDDLLNGDSSVGSSFAEQTLENFYTDTDEDGIPDLEDNTPNFNGDSIVGDIVNIDVDAISQSMDELIQGFGCGFGGGSCLNLPLNWAPLAPGNDPVLLGRPVGDGLRSLEGIPFYSYPLFGGGIYGPHVGVRMFYTPTLTGANGLAVCYGDNVVTGNIPPIGLAPIVPGGNCIVAAKPMNFCSGKEVNGDPRSIGTPSYFKEFGIINGNCSVGSPGSQKQRVANNQIVEDYLDYQNLVDGSTDVFPNLTGTNFTNNNGSLFSMNGGNSGLGEISVDLDLDAIGDGNFQDVIKVKNTRISAFPGFLMDWVTRQIEEIVNKITDLPTVYIILPDLEGIFSGDWSSYINDGVKKSYKKGIDNKEKKDNRYNQQITTLSNKKTGLECDGKDALICANIDLEIAKVERKKGFGFEKKYSGIKQAYEFLGRVPFVSIKPEVVALNIPWVDKATLNKSILDWKSTAKQWKQELKDASNAWTLGGTCDKDDEDCKAKNKLKVDVTALIASLERNIAILEDYKKFPEKLSSLVNKKQEWLEQITYNIETISKITGGWIGKNGKRFKAWVELYVLIKAILKSWQLLADIFIDFDAECYQCKNERYDLIGFYLKLVDFIIPKIPVVKFPKWPDVVLDLHNIRANLEIQIPEFDFNLRPIVLPILPQLNLPDTPTITFDLLPELPIFNIPKLPDIPILPQIKLPDLPPPPKLPKIFASLEGVLDILKLVTKALCILKKSPFVPEWRAGDQISFLTERSGFLNFDFLDVSLPQFSFPFVDAIEVTTYVNLEFETDFLVEMARNISIPLDGFTSNVVNMFDVLPREIKVDGPVDINVPTSYLDKSNDKLQVNLVDFIKLLTLGTGQLSKNILEQSKDELTSAQFIALMNKKLQKVSIIENPLLDGIREVWSKMNNITYSKEDKMIADLLKSNTEKFDSVIAIINSEKQKNKKLQNKIKSIDSPVFAKNIASFKADDFGAYNKTLEVYNNNFKKAAKKLLIPEDTQKKEFQIMGDNILSTIKPVLSTDIPNMNKAPLIEKKQVNYNRAVAISDNNNIESNSSLNSCQAANSGDYKYNYKGLYVFEGDISYNLFVYFDELDGKEKLIETDIDLDSDMDLLYQMGTDLYLKENLDNSPDRTYVTEAPLVIDSSENKFVNGDTYYESVNSFKEIATSPSSINVGFKADVRDGINNYRLEYFTIVDKYLNQGDDTYIPEKIKKNIVDAFADSDNFGIEDDGSGDILNNIIGSITGDENKPKESKYKTGKDIVYIRSLSDNLDGVTLRTKKLKNINEDLNNGEFVVLSSGTKLYSGSSGVIVKYLLGDEVKTLSLDSNSYVQFKTSVKIFADEGAEAYVSTEENVTYKGPEIVENMLDKPLVFGSRIEVDDEKVSDISYIELKYYDGSEYSLDFNEVESYEVYDLGYRDTSYLISLDLDNDYYYTRIHTFTENISGTYSRQVLLAPQAESDQTAPDFDFNSKIRVPVYQEKTIDFSDYIHDNSREDVTISIGEGIEEKYYEVNGTKVKFGKFDTIFTKDIEMILADFNGNITKKNIELEVYSPNPEIESYDGEEIKGAIDESLSEEPINIYRVRGSSIKKLEGKANTDEIGKFIFPISEDDSNSEGTGGVDLEIDGKRVLTIDESSGLITILEDYRSKYEIQILPKNILNYPEIVVKEILSGDKVYSSVLRLNGDVDIKIVNSFDIIEENGLYVDIDTNSFNYYIIPDTVRYNPGALVIYKDDINSSVFVISPDGKIKVSSGYSLDYSSYEDRDEDGSLKEDYVVFKMKKNNGDDVGEILFKIENGFLIR